MAESGVMPEDCSTVRNDLEAIFNCGDVVRSSGTGNVICGAGTTGATAGFGGSTRAAVSAAYGEIGAAENALDLQCVAFAAFHLCRILCAGKKNLKTFIAFQTLKLIYRHNEPP